MVRIGVIGAGFMGGMHSQCYALLPGAKLIGIADIRKEKAEELAKKFGATAYQDAQALLKNSEVDAVDICLPTYIHKEWVVKAANSGKHLLCEKPIALSLKDANEMVDVARKNNITFMIAQVIRFWPEYIRLKEIKDSGELGRLLSLALTRLSPLPTWGWENWLQIPEKSGSALFDLHIHDTDYILYLLGRPKTLFSSGTKIKGGYGHIFSLFEYPDSIVSAEGGWDFVDTLPFRMAFVARFEKGVVEYNTSYNKPFGIYTAGKSEYPKLGEDIPRVTDTSGNISELGGYYNEIKYFVECVQAKKKPTVVTPEDARDSLALVLKEMESAEKGEKICEF
ncbi:MAG: Gfo/Idh/MocA family oxidoreductase [Candidatus Omnitrophica bacterium]|nr:Gfo/Idh/MocA family oxidoreductase [Candidatus Omnitrophota bacterium]